LFLIFFLFEIFCRTNHLLICTCIFFFPTLNLYYFFAKKESRTKLQRIKKNVERIFNLKDRSIWFVFQLNMIVICYVWCNCKEQMKFFYLHSMWSYFSTIIFPSTIIKQTLKSANKKQILLDTQTWKSGEKNNKWLELISNMII
jgi:hypothetical protein